MFLFFISNLFSFKGYIAIGKDMEVDLLSAKLIAIFDEKKDAATKLSIKLKEAPIKALNEKDATFALVRGDQVFEASKVTHNLRSVVALYPELLTFVVRKDSNIISLTENNLKIAYVGEDTKEVLKYIYEKLDLNISTLMKVDQNQTTKMLNEKSINGYISLFVHPSAILKKQSQNIDIRFVNFREKSYSQMIRSNSFLLKSKIHKDMYNIQNHDIAMLGVKTLLVTTKDNDEKTVYKLTKAILDNIGKFKTLNPIYKDFSKKDLLEELVIPQHNGAIKAFNNMKEDDNL